MCAFHHTQKEWLSLSYRLLTATQKSHFLPLAIHHHPSIRMQALPADSAGVHARKEDEARGYLAGLDGPSHGRAERLLRLCVHGGRDQGRPDRAGADLIAADSLAHELVGEAAGEGRDGAFGAGIVEEVGTADESVDGAVVDDAVAGMEVRDGVFGEVEVGVNVCVKGEEPLVSAQEGSEVDNIFQPVQAVLRQ